MEQKNQNQEEKKKGFFSRVLEKIDKKMENKAKKTPCCGSDKDKGSSCC